MTDIPVPRHSGSMTPTMLSPQPNTQADRPPAWWVYLLLPLLHFASVKLTFLCAVSPENEVVIWLPNAVLLAALLHFRGRRGGWLALLTFSSDVLANLPVFPPLQAVLLSLVNLTEVTLAYLLLRRAGTSPALDRIQDLGKFVVIGPLLCALVAALLASLVLQAMDGVRTPYPTLVLLWWFGDGLGLLIFTPMLLALAQPAPEPIRLRWQDGPVLLFTAALAGLILSGQSERWSGVPLTPNLLLPPMLYIAVRFGTRWTAPAVALIALAAAWAQTTGHKPFGEASPHELVLRTQEFILTLSIVGMGFATLLSEQRALTRSLEDKVRERTLKLEESNSQLGTLSTTDGLTGIANRRRFDEFIAGEWRHARLTGQPLALALLDVDLFKHYNDRYGHQAGDDCLRTIAQVLSANVRRAGDLVARYGGEEFALVAVAADEASALAMSHGICQALEALGHRHERSPFGVVTASIGVAVLVPGEHDTHETLIRRADRALYQAKANGRNQAVLASDAPA